MRFQRKPTRNPDRIGFAREQRKQANEFSNNVWLMLRNGRMLNEKFRREYPLGPYTLDFVCLELKLNIEIDGKDHRTEDGVQHDSQRDAYVRKLGYEVLRINGFRVTQDPVGVKSEIEGVVRRLKEVNSKSSTNNQAN